ncbi:helix-turn-helix domain-containing protein [Streptomyces sp. NPDC054847]
MSSHETNRARVVPLRPAVAPAPDGPAPAPGQASPGEPLWREVVGGVLRRERLAQERTLKDVADAARISVPYLSELERGRKEASSEILAAAAHALGLGLADLLALSHRELVRPVRSTTVRSTTARSTTARFGRTVGAARQGDVRLAA